MPASISSTTPRSTPRASPRPSWARCSPSRAGAASSYIVSTKFFWGLHDGPNEKNTLNRKYLMQAIDGSLARLQLDYVDLVYCHRPDAEHAARGNRTCDVRHDRRRARPIYWGTSEWSAAEIAAAWHIADRHGWHKPVTEQPQYNLFHRERVEREYARLYDDLGIGTTIWSPLASGSAHRQVQRRHPEGLAGQPQRLRVAGREHRRPGEDRGGQAARPIAPKLGCTLAQMSLAWCLKNPHVSTVITGASRPAQVDENMKALDVVAQAHAGGHGAHRRRAGRPRRPGRA